MLVKFLVLTINKIEFVAQYDLFNQFVSNGLEFNISGKNKDVVQYLISNGTDIINNSDSNIAMEWVNDKFRVTIDEEDPEFSYKGVSVTIQEMYVRQKVKDVSFISSWEEGNITTKAKLHIDSGEVFDIESSEDGSEYETLLEQMISIDGDLFGVYQNQENVFFTYRDDLQDIQSLVWRSKE